jgi:ribonucleoside-diphosphate reductase alpha chain
MFSDTVNNNTVDIYKDKNLRIHSSNLCSEILLPTDKDNSFVCDLSSVNLLYYDEWKDTDLVETVVFLLDAVMTEFIEKASKIKYMERAVNFAKNHRALGLGVIGWHSYLQSNMIAYESMKAKNLNSKIFKDIKTKSYDASKKLAEIYGEPTLLSGYGRRNTTLMAIAPTKSSAFIMGQASESTEVEKSNYYIKDLAKIKVSHKNPYLIKVLEAHGKNTEIVWDSILKNNGSVQHLEFLTEHERNVFKASWEISVMEVIIQAAQRQKYIDQGQSLNIMIHPSTPAKEINTLMIEAWKMGIKTLYYQYSMNAAQEFNRALLECKSCEG